MNPERTQVIVSQGHKGHRLMYVRLLAEAALAQRRMPILALDREARGSEEFKTHLSALDGRFHLVTFDGKTLKGLLSSLPNVPQTDPIVFVEGDAWLRPLLFAPRLKAGATALVMRPESQSAQSVIAVSQTLAKQALRAVLRTLHGYGIYVLSGATNTRPIGWEIPDPGTMSAEEADGAKMRQSWDRAATPPPKRWIGIVGGIGPRKNLSIVARALASVQDRFGLVVAGEAECDEKQIEEWLSPATSAGVPIVRLAGTLSEKDFDSVIRGLDCVVVAHSNEGPSGILAKAVLARTKVAAAGARSLQRDAAAARDLVRWSELTPEGIAASLKSLSDLRPEPTREATSGTEKFCSALLGTNRSHTN